VVDLEGGIDAVWSRIRRETRRNVRISEREKVVVTREKGPEAVSTFYSLHMNTIDRRYPGSRPLRYYGYRRTAHEDLGESIYQALAAELGASIFIASLDRTPLAVGFAIAFGHKLVGLYAGTSNTVPSARASYALQWEMIKWAVESGCSIYDMGGMPQGFDPADPTHSYGVFKTHWGGRLANYTGPMIAPVLGPLDPVVHGLEAALLRLRRPIRVPTIPKPAD
jgi:lipid II:glycine glycyltransferase (peptidoglycan interpeptide bridge formation enzyme)